MTMTEPAGVYTAEREDASDRRSHLERIFAVLAAFQDNSGLSLAELTRRVSLPKTTVHRIVHELRGVGVLTHDGDRYRVGLQLFAISMCAPYAQLRDAAAPVLRQLAATTEATVGLAILDDGDAVYLDRTLGKNDHARTGFAQPGSRLPAHSCASGKVLLATSNTYPLAEQIPTVLRRVGPRTITDPERLAQELAVARQRRVAVEDGESAPGVIAMAAAIPQVARHGPTRGAITVRGPFRNNEQAAEMLRRAARVIGERLGAA